MLQAVHHVVVVSLRQGVDIADYENTECLKLAGDVLPSNVGRHHHAMGGSVGSRLRCERGNVGLSLEGYGDE